MTILIFIQVGIMIMERYIARTNVRRHNRSKNAQKVIDKVRANSGKTVGHATTTLNKKSF